MKRNVPDNLVFVSSDEDVETHNMCVAVK